MRSFSDATGAMLFYGLTGAKAPVSGDPVNAARWLIPQRRGGGRSWIEVDQGKRHLTAEEVGLGVASWRPYEVVIDLRFPDRSCLGCRAQSVMTQPTSLWRRICNESHMFVVAAMNEDVKTFDSMVAALRYRMYQHVVVVNAGEFGGSTVQALYDREHLRVISHSHAQNFSAVNVLMFR